MNSTCVFSRISWLPRVRFLVCLLGLLLATGIIMAGEVRHEYDGLGRLIKVEYPNGWVIDYTYDASGNTREMTDAAGNVYTASTGTGVVFKITLP